MKMPSTDLIESKATRVMLRVIEDEGNFMKSFVYDQFTMAQYALKRAGFKVEEARREEDYYILKFSWPSPNMSIRLDGIRRAREVLEPFIRLRPNNHSVLRKNEEPPGISVCLVRARIEDDPKLWEVAQIHPAVNSAQAFFDILYNGQKAGEVFCTGFSGAIHQAIDIRDEMVALHKIFPFYPKGWEGEGTAWGSGPAVNWWRKNRDKLGYLKHNLGHVAEI